MHMQDTLPRQFRTPFLLKCYFDYDGDDDDDGHDCALAGSQVKALVSDQATVTLQQSVYIKQLSLHLATE